MKQWVTKAFILTTFIALTGCGAQTGSHSTGTSSGGNLPESTVPNHTDVSTNTTSTSDGTNHPGSKNVSLQNVPKLTAVDFVDANHGYIAGQGVIYGTKDGGTTWNQLYTGTETAKGIDFVNSTTGYVIFPDFVLKTTDAGKTWFKNPSFFDVMDMKTSNEGFGLQNGSLYRLVNSFKGTRLNTPIKADSMSFVDLNTGYIGGQGQVYKTLDGGRTWTKVYQFTGRNSGQWAVNVKALGNEVWVNVYGGDAGMSQGAFLFAASSDAGKTWTPKFDEGYFQPDYGVSVEDPGNIGTNLGVFSVNQNGQPVIVNGYGMMYLMSTTWNGKSKYSTSNTAFYFDPSGISFADPLHGWLVGSSGITGHIAKTVNGGKTWTEVE